MPKSLVLLLAGALALAGCTPAGDRAPTGDAAPAPVPLPLPAPQPTSPPAPPSPSAQPGPGATPGPAAENDQCGADRLSAYLNQFASPETAARIQATVGHDRIRTIKPGDAVTMDFRPDRLNVEIGEDGRIKRVRCG